MAILPFLREVPKDKAQWDRFFRKATVGDADITNDKLRDSSGWSVIGRSQETAGTPDDISADANGEFLRVYNDILGFGPILETELPADIKRTYTPIDLAISATLAADSFYKVTASSSVSLILPSPESGKQIVVKKIGGYNTITVSGAIDSYSSVVIKQTNAVISFYSDGVQWYIYNHSLPYYPVADAELTISSPTISGSGAVGPAGSGSLSVSSPTVSGSGTVV